QGFGLNADDVFTNVRHEAGMLAEGSKHRKLQRIVHTNDNMNDRRNDHSDKKRATGPAENRKCPKTHQS
ncbi:MAG: hypothetical protein WBV46_17065, partial [Terriglobales bacterium]